MIAVTEQASGIPTCSPGDQGQLAEAVPLYSNVDQSDINASAAKYERLSNMRLRNSDTVVLGGYGCFIKIINGSFCVEYQRPHEPGVNKVLKLNRGVHKVKQIIIMVKGGYITLDALEWLVQQGITVFLMSFRGEVLQVLTPKQQRNAKLAYLQCKASESDLALEISIELIRLKTLAQIATLEKYPQLAGQASAMNILEEGLQQLHKVQTIDRLRTLEGRLAMPYFNTFVDVPIKFDKQAARSVPEHWTSITDRTSPLSKNHGGWHAVNPYHAILNFAYALLECQILQAINIAGLEPSVPFLHAYQEGRYALAWDFRMGNEEIKKYILASCRINPVEIDWLCRWLRSTLENS